MPPEKNTDSAESAEKKEDILRPLRTYQADVESALRTQGGSLAKIAIAENRRATDILHQSGQKIVVPTLASNTNTPQPPLPPSSQTGIRSIQREIPPLPQIQFADVSPEGGVVSPEERAAPLESPVPAVPIPLSFSGKQTVRALAEPPRQILTAAELPREGLVVPPSAPARAGAGGAMFPDESQTNASRARFFIIVSLILLIVGGATIGALFFLKGGGVKDGPLVPIGVGRSAILSADNTASLDVTGKKRIDIVRLIRDERGKAPLSKGTVSILFITEKIAQENQEGSDSGVELLVPTPLTAPEFATRLDLKMPASLLRSLENDFVIGFYGGNAREAFIVFKTKSFETAFGGMLSWEKNLEDDLFPIIGRSVTATTTRRISSFVDIVVRNKDARSLRLPVQEGSEAGVTTFLYALPDKETIVITASEEAFTEINKRLLQRQLVR